MIWPLGNTDCPINRAVKRGIYELLSMEQCLYNFMASTGLYWVIYSIHIMGGISHLSRHPPPKKLIRVMQNSIEYNVERIIFQSCLTYESTCLNSYIICVKTNKQLFIYLIESGKRKSELSDITRNYMLHRSNMMYNVHIY